ncbi:MAG: putative 4-hydroxybenzoate polyprenyltransferase [Planctomycetes bacterium]|nr:putative 4-hydroxybenzoate polyprenyltransferase [Planctomycetota bacterium]
MLKKLYFILKAIKFEHTVFALPFAVISVFFAARSLPEPGLPAWSTLGWILLAMVSARSAAMGFNRIIDLPYDQANPRTQDRPVPRGQLSINAMRLFVICMSLIFIFATAQLNLLTLALSPVALLIILSYSYSKRFTVLTHLWLGLCLAMAPVGAWLAVTDRFDTFPLMLGAAVACWTAGFDIIYATQDVKFDRTQKLYSIPKSFGVPAALKISAALHLLTLLILICLIPLFNLGLFYLLGCLLISALLIYEHAIIKPDDLKKVNRAFFNVNAVVSLVLMTACLIDLFI